MNSKETIHSAVQDAPKLTAAEYSVLTGIAKQTTSASLHTLRQTGFVKSEVGDKGYLVWESIKPLKVASDRPVVRRPRLSPNVKITPFVRLEYDGITYELPVEVIRAIKALKGIV
jgi:hypothetical protein